MRTSAILAAAILTVAIAAPALSDPTDVQVLAVRKVGDSFVVKVPYGDLDLRQPTHVDILAARLDRAERQVCSPHLYQPMLSSNQRDDCVADAKAGVQPQMRLARQRASEFAQYGTSAIPQVSIVVASAF